MTAPKSSARTATTGRTWLIRIAIAVGAGLAAGAAGGVASVKKFDPGRAGQPDSLQLVLDSMRQRAAAGDPRSKRRAADSTDADQRARNIADSMTLANDPDASIVPQVLNLEEGAARTAIESARLTVGAVLFQPSTAPLGVVVGTTPAGGQKARPGTAVNLILSDGRKPPADTAPALGASAQIR